MHINSSSLSSLALAALIFPGIASAASLKTHRIVPEKELLITDVAVVDSPLATFPGPFSFGHLIRVMAGKNDPYEFIKSWLAFWEKDHEVNTHPIPARKKIRDLLIDPWKEKDGFAGLPDSEWKVNFDNAPFRLLAIVNRTDLAHIPAPPKPDSTRRRGGYFGGGIANENAAGEGRFVFGVLDSKGAPLPGDFTVIFEYELPTISHGGTVGWAKNWHTLGEFKEFDGDYLAHLATLTSEFTAHISQVRTSEASFDPEREFREFGLGKEGFLQPKTLAATPATRFTKFRVRTQDNEALADLINDNAEAIKSGEFRLPNNLNLRDKSSAMFLAARALIPEDGGKTFHWDARFIKDEESRRILSFNTCNGCHAAETDTDSCLHIHPRAAGEPAQLSKFLQIGKTSNVANPGAPRFRVRLAEMDRRIEFFTALLNPDLSIKQIQSIKRQFGNRTAH